MSPRKKVSDKSKKMSRKSKSFKQNINVGLKAEKKVRKEYEESGYDSELLTPNKMQEYKEFGYYSSTHRPDVKIEKNGEITFVEVKSLRDYVGVNYVEKGRAQFNKLELNVLAVRGDIIVFEIRDSDKEGVESGKKSYYQANAVDVWEKVKNEKGDEVKIEYSDIILFEPFNPDESLNVKTKESYFTNTVYWNEYKDSVIDRKDINLVDLRIEFSDKDLTIQDLKSNKDILFQHYRTLELYSNQLDTAGSKRNKPEHDLMRDEMKELKKEISEYNDFIKEKEN